MDSEPLDPSDQQPIKRIIGRKTRELSTTRTPLPIAQERIEFSRQKTRSGIAPRGIFRYKSHSQANADMGRWVSESIHRFEIAKACSINLHDLVADRGRFQGPGATGFEQVKNK